MCLLEVIEKLNFYKDVFLELGKFFNKVLNTEEIRKVTARIFSNICKKPEDI